MKHYLPGEREVSIIRQFVCQNLAKFESTNTSASFEMLAATILAGMTFEYGELTQKPTG